MATKKVLLFGLGFFQRRLLKILTEDRPAIVVDVNSALVEQVINEYSNVEGIVGEASSIIIWRKINFEDISHIVSSLQDFDVALEICRIARQVYNLQIPIVLMLYRLDRRDEFEKYDVKIINPLLIAAESVLNIIQKNYAKPYNIGLSNGEIVEITVRRRSHIIDRKLSALAPSRWKVAAAYRNGSFLLPDGDFKMQIGDRVVLVGDPKVVDNIVNILMVGKPEFPLQYGQNFAVLVMVKGLVEKDAVEINYFFNNTKAKKYLWYDTEDNQIINSEKLEIIDKAGAKFGGTLKNFRSAAYLHDIGTLAISGNTGFGLFNKRLKYYFKKTHHPILISRGNLPYGEVLVFLNGNIPERLIETGSEIAMHFGITCRCVYVAPPGALKTNQDDKNIALRKSIVRDYENLTKSKIPFIILEGNPVYKILLEVEGKSNSLIVAPANSKDMISLLNPHASYLIALKTKNSVLVLPDE